MADGAWKGVQSLVIGHFKQLSQNKFFDPSTPSMRKSRDGEMELKKLKKLKIEKIMVKIVATTSLPVDRLTATDCNAAARANILYLLR